MLRLTPAALLFVFLGVATAEGRQVDPGARLRLPPFNYNLILVVWPEDLRLRDAEPASQRTARLRELVARGDDSVETGLALADALRSGGEKAAATSLLEALGARLADAEVREPGNPGVQLDYGRVLYARSWGQWRLRAWSTSSVNHTSGAPPPLSRCCSSRVRQPAGPDPSSSRYLPTTLTEEGFVDWLSPPSRHHRSSRPSGAAQVIRSAFHRPLRRTEGVFERRGLLHARLRAAHQC